MSSCELLHIETYIHTYVQQEYKDLHSGSPRKMRRIIHAGRYSQILVRIWGLNNGVSRFFMQLFALSERKFRELRKWGGGLPNGVVVRIFVKSGFCICGCF